MRKKDVCLFWKHPYQSQYTVGGKPNHTFFSATLEKIDVVSRVVFGPDVNKDHEMIKYGEDQIMHDVFISLMDFPNNNALFELVSYNDPWQIQDSRHSQITCESGK